MGILDDAIREHLELKRKHGAEPDDLARLEKEAFGPARRPGDEDYGTAPDGEEPPTELVTEGEPSERMEQSVEPSTDEPGGFFDHLEDEPGTGDEREISPAAQARIEHSSLDDTVDHPAVSFDDEVDHDSGGTAESEIFGPEDEVDLDLDLDLDADAEPSGPTPSEGAPGSEVDQPERPEPELGERSLGPEAPGFFDGETEAPIVDDADEDPAGSDEQEGGRGEEADAVEEDDLLEETPEFLEDAPEGERLWFEQGEPQDFDFDD